MASGMCLLVYPAQDVESAKALFKAVLGVDPYIEGAYYTGFRSDGLEIGLDPNGTSSGPIAYWAVDDIKASLQRLIDAGGEVVQGVRKVGPNRHVAAVKDAKGSTIGLLQDS